MADSIDSPEQPFLKLTAKRVAHYIAHDTFMFHHYVLNGRLSDLVLEELCKRYVLTPLINREIIRKFNATKITIPTKIDRPTLDMLLSQHWKQITFPTGEHFKRHPDSEMPIEKLIMLTLNHTSRKILEKISFSGDGLTFQAGWVKKLSLPSLTSLAMPRCPLDPEDFQMLCEHFPRLQKLDISESGIKNLNGISNMKGLKILLLYNCELESKEDILDLFKLKFLQILDITGDPEKMSQNLKFLIGSGLVLPKLQVLDAAYNSIDYGELEKLRESHKTLKILNIVGSHLETIPPGRYHILPQIISVHDHDSCVQALAHYIQKPFKTDIVAHILNRTYFSMPDPNEPKNYKRMAMLLNMLLYILDNHVEELITVYAVSCLQVFCRTNNFTEMVLESRQNLIITLQSLLSEIVDYTVQSTPFKILASIWKIFVEPKLMTGIPSKIIEELFDDIIWRIITDRSFPLPCLTFVLQNQKLTSLEYSMGMAKNEKLVDDLMGLTQSENLQIKASSLLIRARLASWYRKKHKGMDEFEIRTFAEVLSREAIVRSDKAEFLNVLNKQMHQMEVESLNQFFGMHEFETFSSLLYDTTELPQLSTIRYNHRPAVISIFVKIWFIKFPEHQDPPADNSNEEKKEARFVDCVLSEMDTYDGYLLKQSFGTWFTMFVDHCAYGPRSNNPRLKIWGQWMLEMILEGWEIVKAEEEQRKAEERQRKVKEQQRKADEHERGADEQQRNADAEA